MKKCLNLLKNKGIHFLIYILTIILVTATVMFSGISAQAATSVDTFAELKAACQSSGTVLITSKIAVTDTITVPKGVTVYLTCSHDSGSTTTDIYRAQGFHGHLFKVNDGATLYVRCAVDGNNKDGNGNLRGTGATGTESTGYYGQALILNYGNVIMDNDKSVLKNNYNPYNNDYKTGLLWTYNSIKYYGLGSGGEGETDLCGSAMLCVNGKFTMSNGQIYGCYADNGPAIYVCNGYSGDVVKVSGGKIHDNLARRYGGAIFAASRKPYSAYDNSSSFVGSRTLNSTGSNAMLTVSGGSIYKNIAKLNSCAVWTGFGATFYMSGGSIYSNTAVEEGGGGIRVNAGGAGTTGGWMCFANPGGQAWIAGGSIYNNTCATNGGAITVADNDDTNNKLTVSAGSIYSNKASNNGGGIYCATKLYISGGNIYKNTSSSNGGGVYLTGTGTLSMSGGNIHSNTATSNGGGVYLTTAGPASTISGGIIYSNTADYGGGVATLRTNGLTLSNVKVYNNTANGSGGGVRSTGALTINSGFYYGNKNIGVYIVNGTATINGGKFGVSEYTDYSTYTVSRNTTSQISIAADATVTINSTSYPRIVSTLLEGEAIGANRGIINLGKLTISNASENAFDMYGTGTSVHNAGTLTINGNFNIMSSGKDGATTVQQRLGIQNTADGTMTMNSADAEIKYCGYRGVVNNGTFNLKAGSIYNNTSADITADNGGGVVNSGDESAFTMTGGSIYNNKANYGGGVYFTTSGKASTFSGGSIYSNTATKSGGGIGSSRTNNVTLSGTAIYSNSANYGGGVYGAGSLVLKGSKIYSNTASDTAGGGLYITGDNSVLTMSSGSVYKNTAVTHGGGIYFTTAGQASTISGGEIYSNTANYGGGFSSYRTNGVTLSNVKMYNNTGNSAGGGAYSNGKLTVSSGFYYGNTNVGVYANSGTLVINGGKFGVSEYTDYSTYTVSRNTDSQITVGSSATATINTTNSPRVISSVVDGEGIVDNCGITNFGTLTVSNTSTNSIDFYGTGNSVYNAGTLNINGILKSLSSSKDGTTTVQNRRGIYNSGTVTVAGDISIRYCGVRAIYNTGTFTMSAGTIYGNKSDYSGGAVYNLGTFNLKGGSIYNNTSASNGGGIYNISDESVGKLVMSGGSIYGNTASSHGAGIYFTTAGDAISITGGSIYSNNATKYGGGICSYREAGLTIGANVKIYSNSGTHGGGVFNSTGALAFSGSLTDNTANYGGGIYNGSTVNVTSGIIDGNTGNQKGGGIYSAASTTVNITGGTISDNFAKYYGGGTYSTGVIEMSGSAKFSGNNTEQYGGGICNEGGTVTLTGGSIDNNNSDVEGGGVYVDGTVTLSGVKITNNTAIHGAGLHLEAGSGTMSGGSIANNTAVNYGGGIHIEDGIFVLSAGSISNNAATSYLARGGGVYNDGTFTMTGGTINGNSVPFESAESNGIETYGGGLYNNGDYAVINLQNGSIYDNSAMCGGGICVLGGTANCTGGKIHNNTAEIVGGGIQNWDTLNLTGVNIYSNVAPEGSGIYTQHTSTVNMSKNAIVNKDNEIYLDGTAFITVPAVFDYTGLVAMVDCDHKDAGRVIAKSEYGEKIGSELLYYEDVNQRFELTFDKTAAGYPAFLRAGDQGAASNTNSGIAVKDVFISEAYTVSFKENLSGYTVTVPESLIKNWYENIEGATVADATVNSVVHAFKGWNTSSDGNGTSYASPLSYSDNANLVLYAQWEAYTLTINYYSNYADSSSDLVINTVSGDKNVLVKQSVSSPSSDLSNGLYNYANSSLNLGKKYYTGPGYWNTKTDGTGYNVHQDTSFDNLEEFAEAFGIDISKGSASVDVYAQWKENTLTVNYYSNYATEAFDGALNKVSSDKNILVRTAKFSYSAAQPYGLHNYSKPSDTTYLGRSKYIATGYWGTTTSGGVLVSESTGFANSAALAEAFGKDISSGNVTVNVYAQWEELTNIIDIDYDGNGATEGEGWTETLNTSNNDSYVLSPNSEAFVRVEVDAKTGVVTLFSFEGWLVGDNEKVYDFGENIASAELLAEAKELSGREKSVVTVYAYWDEFPMIEAVDRWFSLDEARNNKITLEELLKTANAIDGDIGDITDFDNGEGTFTIVDFDANEFADFNTTGSVTVTYVAKDNVGNETFRTITVYIVDKDKISKASFSPVRYIRFVGKKYYKNSDGSYVAEANGGLNPGSVWINVFEYEKVLTEALNNKKNSSTGKWDKVYHTWTFNSTQIAEAKAYVEEHGLGNSKESGALTNFYNLFKPKK